MRLETSGRRFSTPGTHAGPPLSWPYPELSREPPSRHPVMPGDAAAAAVEAEMPAAKGEHRLDPWQARPIDRGVARPRNPRVIQCVQNKRWPPDASKEMLGGIAFVILPGIPVTEVRCDKPVVELVDVADSGDGGPFGGAHARPRRQRLSFHRIEHGAVIEHVAPGHHLGTSSGKVNRGGYCDGGQHRKAVPAFAHEFQHEIA